MLAPQLNDISVEDYLKGERVSEQKYEYVEGQVYAMAGASLSHNIITGNCYGLLWNHLRGKSCFPVSTDMLLKTKKDRYRYPDLMVICQDDTSQDEYVRESPTLIIEVLSNATRRKDKTEKRLEYIALPSVQEYLLIEQDFAEIQLQRRRTHWQPEYYYLGEEVHLESVDLTVSVLDIYERVENADMVKYKLEIDKLITPLS